MRTVSKHGFSRAAIRHELAVSKHGFSPAATRQELYQSTASAAPQQGKNCIRARLQPCRKMARKERALAPAMSRPSRNASSNKIRAHRRTFFATTKTAMGRPLFQVERNAALLIEILRELVAEQIFELHDFVIMPDHLHLLLSIDGGCSIEKAMQFIKGRFSLRIKREDIFQGEVWQRGFSEVRITDAQSFDAHRLYIAQNPVQAGLVAKPNEYAFCFSYLRE
ncbi:MAG: transposase, partial [Terracidiphilus sp.]